MKKRISYLLKIAACVAVFSSAAAPVFAQGFTFFQPQGGGEKKRSGKVPTVINSDVMDIDIAKNIAVFTNNVKVDDEEMTITCRKMTIYLEDKKPEAPPAAGEKPKTAKPEDAKPEEGKQVSRIICEENVVIIRKPSNENEKSQGEQKAVAGHSDYDVKTGKIVLTKDPALIRQDDVLRGEVIVIWRDSEKVEVTGKSEMIMSTDTVNNTSKDDTEPDKDVKDRKDEKKPSAEDKTPVTPAPPVKTK